MRNAKCAMRNVGDPEGTRTLNPQNRNLILYPIELRDRITVFSVKC
jgi:hypothetical protein